MKIDKDQIINGLMLGLIMAVLSTVIQTHFAVQELRAEVKALRHDVDRTEEIITNIIMETVK